jgi:hypothetical protein
MTGGHLAKLMRKHRHRQKRLADDIGVTARTIQNWTSSKNLKRPLPAARAIQLLRKYQDLSLASDSGIDEVILEAVLALTVFEQLELSYRPTTGRRAPERITKFSQALRGAMGAESIDADTKRGLLYDVLIQLEKSDLDATRLVAGLREESVVLESIRRHLGAQKCRLHVQKTGDSLGASVDRIWLARALKGVEQVDEVLWELRTGLRRLLDGN